VDLDDAWTTPVFAILSLDYPDLVWDQPFIVVRQWGRLTHLFPNGPLTTL